MGLEMAKLIQYVLYAYWKGKDRLAWDCSPHSPEGGGPRSNNKVDGS